MAFVAVAIGGAAVVGAGAGVAGSLISSSAAKKAGADSANILKQQMFNAEQTYKDIQTLYAPYIAAGTNALGVLQGRITSSTERQVSVNTERQRMVSRIAELSRPLHLSEIPVPSGGMASERWEQNLGIENVKREAQAKTLKQKLALFDKNQAANAPLYAAQDAENNTRMERITTSLNRVAELSDIPASLADIREQLQDDPVYKFRQAEGERAINRAATARGGYFSGAAIGKLSDFSLALTGEETDKFIARQVTALEGAIGGLNAELGEQNQGVNQALSLATLGANAVAGQANAAVGVAGQQAQLTAQNAQTTAQTTIAQGQALQQGLGSIAGTAGSLATLAMFSRGKADTGTPTVPATASSVPASTRGGAIDYSSMKF